MSLPDHIKALAELSPAEDLFLAALRAGLPGVGVQSLIEAHQTFPFVLCRRLPTFGDSPADSRWTDVAEMAVQTLCEDPNGDEDAAILAEAVRVVLRNAWLQQTVFPGRGHFLRVDLVSAPRRAPDWATATGPVQYADLPTGVWRYETIYRAHIRRPVQRPYPLPTP